MTDRYFSVEEANDLLPKINPLMDQLQARRRAMIASREDVINLLNTHKSDFGGAIASNLVNDFIAIERLAKQIQSHGCIIKDLNTGLVDFLSTRDGREIYLCWQHGEPQIAFYHELHSGYKGRRQL
jgi:hypothetical protein